MAVMLVILLVTLMDAEFVDSTTIDVFESGEFPTTNLFVNTSNSAPPPPKPLLIVSPTISGKYPVILFHHGFYLQNYFYTDLLHHISSHGYILVAPQLYQIIPISQAKEIELAAEVANWLLTSLAKNLPEKVEGDLNKLSIAGHSRGGKTAFALALNKSNTPLNLYFSALFAVDPVAGLSKNLRTEPHILTYVADSFNLTIPIAIIGTGLGNKWNGIIPPCAPNEVNHQEFYNESKPPKGHFVATDYGHLDMLNDDLGFFESVVACFLCKNGEGKKDLMRRSVGGIFVAFLEAYLDGEFGNYLNIVDDPSISPAKLDPVQFVAQNHAQF